MEYCHCGSLLMSLLIYCYLLSYYSPFLRFVSTSCLSPVEIQSDLRYTARSMSNLGFTLQISNHFTHGITNTIGLIETSIPDSNKCCFANLSQTTGIPCILCHSRRSDRQLRTDVSTSEHGLTALGKALSSSGEFVISGTFASFKSTLSSIDPRGKRVCASFLDLFHRLENSASNKGRAFTHF